MNADSITLADAMAAFSKAVEAHSMADSDLRRAQNALDSAERRHDVTRSERKKAHEALLLKLGEVDA